MSCRFCYAYKPPSLQAPCCPPQPPPPLTLSTVQAMPSLANNSSQTTSSAYLQATTRASLLAAASTAQQSTIAGTIANTAVITSTLQNQLAALQSTRYAPYQPYIPPVVPVSVMELQMKTANVGNPMPPNMKCKGSQFVTK